MAGRDVPMSVRRLIVEIDVRDVNVVRFCEQHGISTWFFYDLRRRHARGESIEARSRAPKRVANRTPAEIEDAVVATRKDLESQGLDAGPASILWSLEEAGLEHVPSESTIWRILTARGLIVAEPAKAPKHAGKRFVASRANECWQTDDTTWSLADGSEVKILNVIDDHSRLLVASVAAFSVTGAFALGVFAAAAVILGWPARFLSDNAKAFRHVLADALGEFGIASRHSRAYHPQTNGKVERFHQTLKRWLVKQPAAATLEELQAQLDLFRVVYNHHRPHRGIGRQRPADAWNTAPKTGPADRALGTTSRVYTGIVNGGCIRLGHNWRITIGASHNNQRALAIVTGTACHVFVEGRLARALTLNPDRVDQPLHHRPGRPITVREVPRHA
jgi:transposase InsO family protein